MTAIDGVSAVLVAATITSGLTAGLLYGFACAVMPGLRQVDDRAFVMVMQSINRRIVNPVFLVTFIGTPVLAVGALVVVAAGPGRWAVVGAVACSLLTIIITAAANVPLNNTIDAAGDPDRNPDPRSVRRNFENRWVRWNIARSVTSTGAIALLAVALVG